MPVAVGGSLVCARSAIGAAPASDGDGFGASSEVLAADYGGSSHGGNTIGAGALKNRSSSSESARGAAVSESQVAVAVGGSFDFSGGSQIRRTAFAQLTGGWR